MTDKEKPLENMPAIEQAQEVYEPNDPPTGTDEPHRIIIDIPEDAMTTEQFAEWYSKATPEEREEYQRNLQESMQRAKDRLGEVAHNMVETYTATDTAAVIKAMQERILESARAISNFIQSDTMQELLSTLKGFSEWTKGISAQLSAADLVFWGQFVDNARELLPYIQEEIKVYQDENGIDDITFEEFMQNYDPETGTDIESVFDKVLKRAQERAAADAAAKEDAERMERLQAVSEQLEQLESVLPKKYVMPNNPLTNSLTGRTDKKTGDLIPIINAGGFDMPVLKSGRPGEVTAYTMVTLDQDETGITLKGKPFTEYDRCVMNSVVTLWEAGNRVFTPEMVCRAMSNKTATEDVGRAQKAAVTKSIEKMRHIFVYSDVSEEFAKRGIKDPDGNPIKWTIDDYLLSVRGHTVKAGGQTKKAYEITKEPILLTYSKYTRQLLTADLRLLDIRRIGKGGQICETIPTTESRQPIKEYLLRRIEVMKNDRRNKSAKQDPHILFDTLYRETGIDAANKTEAKRAREYTAQVLDYWTAAGYIKGHEIQKDGRKLHSILIKL